MQLLHPELLLVDLTFDKNDDLIRGHRSKLDIVCDDYYYITEEELNKALDEYLKKMEKKEKI